jgi:hypothetical protein
MAAVSPGFVLQCPTTLSAERAEPKVDTATKTPTIIARAMTSSLFEGEREVGLTVPRKGIGDVDTVSNDFARFLVSKELISDPGIFRSFSEESRQIPHPYR